MNKKPEQNDASIGDIISRINSLDADQVNEIVKHQQANGLKFGESAVALGLAKREDILWALSQQFNYPYQGQEDEKVSNELVVATDPFGATAEFFRDVRTQLLTKVFDHTTNKRQALAVCSTDVGDGKSFFCANLAVAFSQLNGRTLLIDADMRTPRQHAIFGIDPAILGLSSVLSGRAEANVTRPIESLPNLFVLSVGVTPPNPLELIQGQAFDFLIESVLSKFEYVLIDTPAASHGSDARVIADKSGAALVVCRKDITKLEPLRALTDGLKRACTTFAGVLANEHR
jgi:protein-tyrosine kinase